jgi:hypothetical protein
MMINYKEWEMINESFNGMNLGLKNPANLGIAGSKFEEGLHDDEDDEEKDELEDDVEDEAGDEESNPDFVDNPQGPEKSFPPDDSEEMDGLPTPDEEMLGDDDIAPELGDENPFGDDGMDGDPAAMSHDDFAAALSKHLGAPPEEPEMDVDMDFLNDIDPQMMGGDETELSGMDMNADADPDELDDLDGEDDGEDDFTFDLDPDEEEDAAAANCMKYMHKSGTKKEQNDSFLASLASSSKGMPRRKNNSGVTEETLFSALDPNYDAQIDQSSAGQVGFAPQGRVGSIGGGYTKDDISSIPVLGESRKYPTLAEYIAKKEAAKNS